MMLRLSLARYHYSSSESGLIVSSDPAEPPLELSDVTIGILTALEEEYAACRRVFDPDQRGREESRRATSGSFTCWLCSIQAKHGGYHVIAISLLTKMGNNAAAIGANILLQHCPKVRSLIMCGIAGAVPHPGDADNHVRLGDIVVTDVSGIVQYDRGKQRDPRRLASSLVDVRTSATDPLAGFEYRGQTHPPCPDLLAAVQRVHSDEATLNKRTRRRWEELAKSFFSQVGNPAEWKRPAASLDVLNDSSDGTGDATPHPGQTNRSGRPKVFRSAIGSANVVQSDPARRDALRDRHKIKAIEMEGSGVADVSWVANVGYLVVRGTCDYCNSTKNNRWHHYAALIAAAYTRTVIEYLHPPAPLFTGMNVPEPQLGDARVSRGTIAATADRWLGQIVPEDHQPIVRNTMSKMERISVMIGSPMDANEERRAITVAIERWNAVNRSKGIFIEPVRWETHATPGLQGRPQGMINAELIPISDILVAVFRSRAGTPTGKEDSGTIEEIREFIRLGKHVVVYFYEGDVSIGAVDPDQLTTLRTFKQKVQQHGITASYANIAELKEHILCHMTTIVDRLRISTSDRVREQNVIAPDQSCFGLGATPTSMDVTGPSMASPFEISPASMMRSELPASFATPVAEQIESDVIFHDTAPSPKVALGVPTELQSRPPSDSETDMIVNLVETIDTLLKEFRFSEATPFTAELEKRLRLLPRRGSHVRDGWIVLARVETQRLNEDKQAGRRVDVTRLRMLRQEADDVTD